MENERIIIRVSTWLAVIGALVVMGILPLSYGIFSYQYIKGGLASEVEINSRLISNLINANPALWRFEQMRLEELLAKRPDSGERESRRVVDLQGRVIAASDNALAPPLITATHEVLDAGLAVGRIEISRSLHQLLVRTGVAALIGFCLGLAIFITIRVLPIRAMLRAEKALRESAAFLARIMQSTTNAIVVFDSSGIITHANQRCTEISGYRHDELIGEPFARLFPAEEFVDLQKRLQEVTLQEMAVLGLETNWLSKDGELIPISWGGAQLSGTDAVGGVVFTAEDIRKRKKAREEREKLIVELQGALSEIQVLRGIIPICSYCKKIRNDDGLWNQLEAYMHEHSGAEFSHSVCPECLGKQLAEMDKTC